MGSTNAQLPIGQQVSLPGHFDLPVTLESARPLAKGFECRVRLPDGTLDEAVTAQGGRVFIGVTDDGREVITLRSLEKSKRITRKEYEELAGASDVTAKRDLTDLVNKRVLVRRGATRNLWYELSGHPMTRK
jgi:predicted HTH transcriptional regulator